VSTPVLVDKKNLRMVIEMFLKKTISTKDLDARIAVIEAMELDVVVRALGGQGFTPEEQADYREEYGSWTVQDLSAAYVRETFKAALLLELLEKRVNTNQQQGKLL